MIIPPPAEVEGPQQGGVSQPLPDSELQLAGSLAAVIFRMLFILNAATALFLILDM